jgi:hypothetical protein
MCEPGDFVIVKNPCRNGNNCVFHGVAAQRLRDRSLKISRPLMMQPSDVPAIDLPDTPEEASDPTLNPQSAAGSLGGGLENDIPTELDYAARLLNGDLGDVPPDVAASTVARWQETLMATGDESLQGIANDLSVLQAQLSSGEPDYEVVSGLLLQLGASVSAAAKQQQGDIGHGLAQLGSALSAAGNKM